MKALRRASQRPNQSLQDKTTASSSSSSYPKEDDGNFYYPTQTSPANQATASSSALGSSPITRQKSTSRPPPTSWSSNKWPGLTKPRSNSVTRDGSGPSPRCSPSALVTGSVDSIASAPLSSARSPTVKRQISLKSFRRKSPGMPEQSSEEPAFNMMNLVRGPSKLGRAASDNTGMTSQAAQNSYDEVVLAMPPNRTKKRDGGTAFSMITTDDATMPPQIFVVSNDTDHHGPRSNNGSSYPSQPTSSLDSNSLPPESPIAAVGPASPTLSSHGSARRGWTSHLAKSLSRSSSAKRASVSSRISLPLETEEGENGNALGLEAATPSGSLDVPNRLEKRDSTMTIKASSRQEAESSADDEGSMSGYRGTAESSNVPAPRRAPTISKLATLFRSPDSYAHETRQRSLYRSNSQKSAIDQDQPQDSIRQESVGRTSGAQLAQQLADLATSHADGLITDDEYRLLREGVFKASLSETSLGPHQQPAGPSSQVVDKRVVSPRIPTLSDLASNQSVVDLAQVDKRASRSTIRPSNANQPPRYGRTDDRSGSPSSVSTHSSSLSPSIRPQNGRNPSSSSSGAHGSRGGSAYSISSQSEDDSKSRRSFGRSLSSRRPPLTLGSSMFRKATLSSSVDSNGRQRAATIQTDIEKDIRSAREARTLAARVRNDSIASSAMSIDTRGSSTTDGRPLYGSRSKSEGGHVDQRRLNRLSNLAPPLPASSQASLGLHNYSASAANLSSQDLVYHDATISEIVAEMKVVEEERAGIVVTFENVEQGVLKKIGQAVTEEGGRIGDIQRVIEECLRDVPAKKQQIKGPSEASRGKQRRSGIFRGLSSGSSSNDSVQASSTTRSSLPPILLSNRLERLRDEVREVRQRRVDVEARYEERLAWLKSKERAAKIRDKMARG